MSTVILDTITGKSTATTITIGSTPVVSASANSMTIRGEGTAHTSIQQGLAKVFCSFDSPTTSNGETIAMTDSLNMTSATDNGTGQVMLVFANDMANDDYVISIQGGESNALASVDTGTKATGQIRIEQFNTSEALRDHQGMSVIFGDLA